MTDEAIADAAAEQANLWMEIISAKTKALPETRQMIAMAFAGASVAASCLFACNPDRAAAQRVIETIVKGVLDDIEAGEG